MSLPAASLPEDLDLEDLLAGLFVRLRKVCPDWVTEVPDCDEVELARRILAAVADPASPTGLAPDQLYVAETAVAELLASQDRQGLLENDPRFESPLVARLLIRKARVFAGLRSRHAVEVADLAIQAAERVNSYTWGHDYTRTTRLQAQCTRVEALRVARRLEEAHREVTRLLEAAEPGLSPRLRGDLHLLAGVVQRDRGELGEAAGLLFVARDVYESSKDEPRLGRTLLQLADVYREYGQIDLAVDSARRATTLLDAESDREAHVFARHNLAIYLCDAGRPIEARAELEGSRIAQGAFPDKPVRLKSLWIEGRIHEQIGDPETAERLYRQVRRDFLEADMPAEAGLAGLDLAWLLVDQHRYEDAFDVSSWLGIVFRRYAFAPALLMALLAFREAVQAEPPAAEQLFSSLETLRTLLYRSLPR